MPRLLAVIGLALLSQASAQLRADIQKDTPPDQATMRVYDGEKLLWQATTQGLSAITESKFSADGKWLLNIADRWGYVQLWNVEKGERVTTFLSPSSRVYGADFTPDSQRLLLSANGKKSSGANPSRPNYFPEPSLWNITPLKRLSFLYNDERQSFYDGAVFFSTDGQRMVFTRITAYHFGPASVWDANTGAHLTTIPRLPYPSPKSGGAGALDARLSPDGRRVLVWYVDERLAEYDADTAKLLKLRGKPTEAEAKDQLETFAQTGK